MFQSFHSLHRVTTTHFVRRFGSLSTNTTGSRSRVATRVIRGTRVQFHLMSGFTLVEVLVAFAVLALILIILLGSLSRMASGGRQAEILREALQLAQAKLDRVGIAEPLAPGDSVGSFQNGFEWRLRAHDGPKDHDGQTAGAWVEITVMRIADVARAPPTVSLVTFKLAGTTRK